MPTAASPAGVYVALYFSRVEEINGGAAVPAAPQREESEETGRSNAEVAPDGHCSSTGSPVGNPPIRTLTGTAE